MDRAGFLYGSFLRNLPLEPTSCQDRMFRQTAEFLTEDDADILVVNGYAGTGKTTAARALGRRSFMLARSVGDWQRFTDFMLRGDFALDDIGTEHTFSEYGVKVEPFADLINALYPAYQAGAFVVPPVFTSNLRSTERNARYGSRVESRIREMFVIVDFGMTDRRFSHV